MVIIQAILCIILLLRIGGILLRKINADLDIGTIGIIVIAMIISSYNMHSITTILLFGETVFYIIINEIYRKLDSDTSGNKYKWTILDIVKAGLIIVLIMVYIYCAL